MSSPCPACAASGGGTVTYTGARERLAAFFADGGGYIGTSVSGTNFTFLTNGGLTTGPSRRGSANAGGGIARWTNTGGAASPVTGAYPATDFWYLPSNVTYFSALPDRGGRSTAAIRTAPAPARPGRRSCSWPASGVRATPPPRWRRSAHRSSSTATRRPRSRYIGFATNPFSRGDFERSWPLIATAALWSNLTDEP